MSKVPFQRLMPATVTISEPTCVPDGSGTDSTLSIVITILRLDVESIDAVEVVVDGMLSPTPPTEQAGSPTTPSSGFKQHKYDWSDQVACGMEHTVKARATVTLTSVPESGTKNADCSACQ